MQKDFSRELQTGMTKESNFVALESPLVAVGKNLNMKSMSIESQISSFTHCISNNFQNKIF